MDLPLELSVVVNRSSPFHLYWLKSTSVVDKLSLDRRTHPVASADKHLLRNPELHQWSFLRFVVWPNSIWSKQTIIVSSDPIYSLVDTYTHEDQCFRFGFFCLWEMQIHLVTIEISIERRTDAFIETKGSMRHHTCKQRHDWKTMQRRLSIEEHHISVDHVPFDNITKLTSRDIRDRCRDGPPQVLTRNFAAISFRSQYLRNFFWSFLGLIMKFAPGWTSGPFRTNCRMNSMLILFTTSG